MSLYSPIFSGLHRRGIVEMAPIALPGILSVSVEDHSSDQQPPKRLWSFLDRAQVSELRQVLGEWLSTEKPTIEDLEVLLKAEDDRPIRILPDGSIIVAP